MCGIFCLISHERNASESSLLDQFKKFESQIFRRGPNSLNTELFEDNILLVSSVLWLQGKSITVQPVKCQNGSVLIYNGDIFGGPGLSFDSNRRQDVGDTTLFLETLQKLDLYNISKALEKLQGPFAFVYLNAKERVIYFARDIFGRRSLLIGKSSDKVLFTSVAPKDTEFDFIELPCIGVFSFCLESKTFQLFPWSKKNNNFNQKLSEIQACLGDIIVSDSVEYEKSQQLSEPNAQQFFWLNQILGWPSDTIFERLLSSTSFMNKVKKVEELLRNSIKKRIFSQPNFCQNCYNLQNCTHATTGVLFSGGVDCAILALLADCFIEKTRPIDLINVAFEKNGSYETPDRLTGLSTLSELKSLCPERAWNFVQVNVTRDELDSCRSQYISHLIYPLKTILDDSLGCALWFASRAKTAHYKSCCRILLVGMGADELFGGYTRHRAAFKKGGWTSLQHVLEEDWENLPHRNLARDDRVVADHGRQLRTPYLDEEVVDYVQKLECWDKTLPTSDLPQGIGEKMLLRCLAHYLGLKNAATLRKRALQFGSRIANSKENAHDESVRL